MSFIFIIFFFILGSVIGSFLNVVIARYNSGRTFGGRSACMICQNKLRWYELVPLLSFLFLRGRCRTCKTHIALTYPVVEFLTGFVFVSLFLKFQDVFFTDKLIFLVSYVFYALAFCILIVVAMYDLKHKIIPDMFSLFFGLLSFVGLFLFNGSFFAPHLPSLMQFLSGFVIALPFALMWLVSGGTWMGFGDAKLTLGIGWLLGISLALSGVVLAFWAGAILGIALMVFSKKHNIKSEIPFAPFLVFGTILAFLLDLHIFSVF